jgi:hypothetical protein
MNSTGNSLPDALPCQREHLRRGVDGGHRASAGRQQRGPVAGAARQLQHVPRDRQFVDAPVPLFAEVGVVVVGCVRPIVGDLLGQERLDVVVHAVSLPRT